MMTHIYRQFERPHGALGALAGFVMSHRPSNRERNRWTVDLIAPDSRRARAGNRLRSWPRALRHVRPCHRRPHRRARSLAADAGAGRATQHAALSKRVGLQLHLGGLDTLTELNGNFDVVYSINVAMFWSDRPSALRCHPRRDATGRASCHHLPAAPRRSEKQRCLQIRRTIERG